KSKHIDLIIMGTQGATGAAQILFGTHTVHAIKRATCPLLAVPSGCTYNNPENILFPTDLDINYGREHLALLKHLARNHNSEIKILHVSFGYPLDEKKERSKKHLLNYFDDVNAEFHNIEKTTVTEGIYDFQKEHDINLLVMISNK